MSILTPATMLSIATALGASDNYLQAQTVTTSNGGTGTALDQLKLARLDTDTAHTASDVDASLVLVQALRKLENSIPSTLGNALSAATSALDSYVKTETGQTLKQYFAASLSVYPSAIWTDQFRSLWRRTRNEELIVQVASTVNSSGTWTPTIETGGANAAFSLATQLQLIVFNTVTTGAINVTISLENPDTSTSLFSITIPNGTVGATAYPIKVGSNSKFIGVNSISTTGGGNTNQLQIWIM